MLHGRADLRELHLDRHDRPRVDDRREAGPNVVITSAAADSYVIVATSKSGNTFTITKATGTGVITRTCTAHATGACKSAADSAGNWW